MSLTKIQALEKTAALWTEVAERTEQRQEVVEPGEILLEMGAEVVNECFEETPNKKKPPKKRKVCKEEK